VLATEELIKKHSLLLDSALRHAATAASSEEELRIASAGKIEAFILDAKLAVTSRHEYGLAGGRIDSKYAGVIIEYKNPASAADKLSQTPSSSGNRKLIKQIENRFRDFRESESLDPSRIFAVGTDGRFIIFVRHRNGAFEHDGPYRVSPDMAERMLRAILSLGANGEAFSQTNLVRDFGSNSEAAKAGIAALYKTILEASSPKAIVLFNQWKLLFSEVCGYDITGQHKKVQKLAVHYQIHDAKPAELLFAVHTYYSIFMKFITVQIATTFETLATSVVRKCASAPTSTELKREMRSLEDGSLWAQLGIRNFLEGDLFAWYLPGWNSDVSAVVGHLAKQLNDYDPATLSVDPDDNRDLLKMLYEQLFPRSVRHDLGEYYTPDWLAEMTLNRIGYDGDPRVRILDPACGSGTFLVEIVRRIRRWYFANRETCGFGDKELLQLILENVIGFDLNPLAVMASKVNLLISVRDLLKQAAEIELPVYLCDSIVLPKDQGVSLFSNSWRLTTSVGIFIIPSEITHERSVLAKYTEILEEAISDDYTVDEFITRCATSQLPITATDEHAALFQKCKQLNKDGQNGIWARIIKNAFAPLFLGKVDLIVGNPPWINWEHMPSDYRDSLKATWTHYGLFSLAGGAARLGGGKKDLSMLFVYAGMDRFLKDGGQLAFVIVQTIFKTQGAGDGFRRFQFTSGPARWYVSPTSVDDLSRIQVFDGATNRAAIFVAEKRKAPFTYPISYTLWNGPSRISQTLSLAEVMVCTDRMAVEAEPIYPSVPTSPWVTLPRNALRLAKHARAPESEKAFYVAQAGCMTWLNGVFWVKVLQSTGVLSLIENLADIGKIKVPKEVASIEADRVVPLLRGRDVDPWHAVPSLSMLLTQDPQTRMGISESEMKARYPKTYGYLKKFEGQLRRRPNFVKFFKQSDPFYTIYGFGPQHLARFKVVWRDMGSTLQAAVVSSETPILPEHHVMFVPVSSEDEAHYVCGALMSSLAKLLIAGYTTSTGLSTHVISTLNMPQYKRTAVQDEISKISRQCHSIAMTNSGQDLMLKCESSLDAACEALWGCEPGSGAVARKELNSLLVRFERPESETANAE
jgi:SAM-dependent methyltransferase